MLVVLSEIDCLDFLYGRGIYPDEFYTDFEMFKNRSILKTDMQVIIIFAGCCHFNKRRVCEFITQLNERVESETDKGVTDVCVISDSVLPNINGYYKYSYFPNSFDKYNGRKRIETDVDVWSEFKGEERECTTFIDSDETKRATVTDAEKHDDELIKLIKVPVLVSR